MNEESEKPVIVRTWRFSRIGSGIGLIIIGTYMLLRQKYWIFMNFPEYFLDDLPICITLGLVYLFGVLLIVSELWRKSKL